MATESKSGNDINEYSNSTGKKVDINCDMGEGMGNDALLMPFIHSANIACGYHAGDATTMRETLELCAKHGVAAGAHPSFFDREGFGRNECSIEASDLYELVTQQLIIFSEFAETCDLPFHHVKPHGALYNQSAREQELARVIAQAVKDFDPGLILYGLSGSHSIKEAEQMGLKTAHEVFADRSYQEDGSLISRKEPNAMISDSKEVVRQVLEMVREGMVTTVSGKRIPVQADTICIHGDGIHAIEFARAIYNALYGNEERTK